jgi:hypothetical protein
MHSATELLTSDTGIIVFDRYGENYFLRQIWTAGNKDGLESWQTRVEKKYATSERSENPKLDSAGFQLHPTAVAPEGAGQIVRISLP